jgi:hypothetical protein
VQTHHHNCRNRSELRANITRLSIECEFAYLAGTNRTNHAATLNRKEQNDARIQTRSDCAVSLWDDLAFLSPDELEWGMKGEMYRRLAEQPYAFPIAAKHTIDGRVIIARRHQP